MEVCSFGKTGAELVRRVGASCLVTLRGVMGVAALAIVAACGTPGTGPVDHAIPHSGEIINGYLVIDVSDENIGQLVTPREPDRPGGTNVQTNAHVRLAPGDNLRIVIAESNQGGLFTSLAMGGTQFPNVRVAGDGTISLPYVGSLRVTGSDLQTVERNIKARLAGNVFEPQVYVELLANRNNSVLVTGAVRSPGRFSMLDGPMTIIDAVSRAGGLGLSPVQTEAVIRRGSSVRRIAMTRVHNGENPSLQPGDTLTIVTKAQVFYAIGSVLKSGQYEFQRATPNLMEGLSQAGWLDAQSANPTGVFVFRSDTHYVMPDGTRHVGNVIYRFNMRRPETVFLAKAFSLRPDDAIYVTTAPAVEWVKQIQPLATTVGTIRNALAVGDQF